MQDQLKQPVGGKSALRVGLVAIALLMLGVVLLLLCAAVVFGVIAIVLAIMATARRA